MEDERYPGMDTNPILPVYEYLDTSTTLKLCEAGFGSLTNLVSIPLDVVRTEANLNEGEYQQLKTVLLLLANSKN